MSLYTIRQEASEIIEKMLSHIDLDTGEILDESSYIEAQKELSEKENQANESMEWVLQYRQNIEGEIGSLDTEIARLSDRKKSLEKKSKSLGNYIEHFFKAMWGGKTISFGTFSLGYRKSTAVQIIDISIIPSTYIRQPLPPPPAPDKTAIAKDLKDGAEIPGVILEERQNFFIK